MLFINNKVSLTMRMISMMLALLLLMPHTVVFALPLSENVVVRNTNISSETTIVLQDEPVIFNTFVYEQSFNYNIATENLSKVISYIDDINEALVSGKYSTYALAAMQCELERLVGIKEKLIVDMDKYHKWEEDYYYAAKVFEFLMARGYSREVTCAIIGNMMVETGGNTLELVPSLYDAETGNYYGLCQWSLYWRPEADKLSFEDQLDYLMSDIEREINTFGFCYKTGFNYNDFINMTDPQEAAVAFAMTYERCAAWSYNKRFVAAGVAYEYFT